MMMNCVASVTNICGFAICDLRETEWAFVTGLELLSSFNFCKPLVKEKSPCLSVSQFCGTRYCKRKYFLVLWGSLGLINRIG